MDFLLRHQRYVVELNMGRFLGTARGFALPEGHDK
jgi:hypothetical protein